MCIRDRHLTGQDLEILQTAQALKAGECREDLTALTDRLFEMCIRDSRSSDHNGSRWRAWAVSWASTCRSRSGEATTAGVR